MRSLRLSLLLVCAPALTPSAGAQTRFPGTKPAPVYGNTAAGAAAPTFHIQPVHPVEELRRADIGLTPPPQPDSLRRPDLVDLTTLDPRIKLEIRYATTNNFMGAAMYSSARAFMQRPAAEAVRRAAARVERYGYGLLIHDAYRPWYVTKMFWDATPDSQHIFVANPATGSKHNRGCAVDLSLYDLRTGRPVRMPSGYDEFSPRAYVSYGGGTALETWQSLLLRWAMEAEGFTVNPTEWWHFDFRNSNLYPVMNLPFEQVGSR